MHLLIPGGAGFIGSNFIRYMLHKYSDLEITNFDKLTYAGNPHNLDEITADTSTNARYHFIKGDIADAKAVRAAIETAQFDAIINYAAETHVDRSIMDPQAFLQTDVIGMFNLLEISREKNIRLVQISTDEVFGAIAEGEFFETSPFLPNSPYAASKAGGDLLCRAYFETYKTPVIVTHCANIYGPYHYPEKLIPLAITNLLEGKKVPVYGDGQQVREWVYVDDHAIAIDMILRQGKVGEVYNIGSGERYINLDTVKLILQYLGKDESSIEYVKDRLGHDRRYAVNHDKFSAELGWQPSMKFPEGLRKTVEWFKARQDWWGPIKSGEYEEYYKRQYGKK